MRSRPDNENLTQGKFYMTCKIIGVDMYVCAHNYMNACAYGLFAEWASCLFIVHYVLYTGILCGSCKNEGDGFTALLNQCQHCGYENILYLIALGEFIILKCIL